MKTELMMKRDCVLLVERQIEEEANLQFEIICEKEENYYWVDGRKKEKEEKTKFLLNDIQEE